MQEKEELKKQVIILGIVLVLAIIVAIILNTNGKKNIDNQEINQQTEVTQNQVNTTNNQEEIINNLKGLIEQTTEEESLDTSESKNVTTSSGETIQYLEKEFEE